MKRLELTFLYRESLQVISVPEGINSNNPRPTSWLVKGPILTRLISVVLKDHIKTKLAKGNNMERYNYSITTVAAYPFDMRKVGVNAPLFKW
jgi:hypothetical protein